MGHAAGDSVLVELGKRFVGQLRDSDTAARIGGDEFAFVCEDLHTEEEATRIAQRLADTLAEPFFFHGKEVQVRASVGVAVAGSPAQDAEELLREADRAMYRAKYSGGPRRLP
jgi:diguanylate cyclase (GGDEF)-like protein